MATIRAYTTIEQSRKLAKLLPIESADMRYSPLGDNMHPWIWTDTFIEKDAVPCWSLATLLATLPNEIITDNRFECHYQIHIRKYDGGDNTTLYQIAYGNDRCSSGSWHDMINTGAREELLDAAFDMVVWLKKNEKI